MRNEFINFLKINGINKDKSDISRWVRGKAKPPLEILDEFVNFTNCDGGWLLSGEYKITAETGSYGLGGGSADLLKSPGNKKGLEKGMGSDSVSSSNNIDLEDKMKDQELIRFQRKYIKELEAKLKKYEGE